MTGKSISGKNTYYKRWGSLLLITVLLGVLLTVGMSVWQPEPAGAADNDRQVVTVSGTRLYDEAYAVLDLVNVQRKQAGLQPVTMDRDLLENAMDRAAEAALSFSHTRPDGNECFSIITRSYSAAGENLAAGQTTAADVMNSWMNSAGHRSNILYSSFNIIGIGALQVNNVTYWVQIFCKGDGAAAAQPANAIVSNDINILESNLDLHLNYESLDFSQAGTRQLLIYNYNNGDSFFSVPLTAEKLVWSSSNSQVAAVDASGLVSGVGTGQAVITAKLGDISLSCAVTAAITAQVNDLQATGYDGKIKLSWDTASGADGYYIYAMHGDGSKYKTYATVKTTCNFTNLKNGDKYQFKVRTYQLNSSGARVYGSYCTAVTAVPQMDGVKNLEALAFNQKIRIDWEAAAGAQGYYIYAAYADDSLYKTYKTTKTYCNFTKLTNGSTYQFKVRPYYQNSAGSTAYGKYCAYVAAAPYNDQVTGLRAKASDAKINISWQAVENADGYYIYAMYGNGSKYKTYSTVKSSCNFTRLTNGSTYKFKVRAYKLDQTGTKVYSTYSAAVSAVPRS